MSLTELFFFSFLESFRMSLQNRCLIIEHAIFVAALTECLCAFPYRFYCICVNEKNYRYVGAKFLFLHI